MRRLVMILYLLMIGDDVYVIVVIGYQLVICYVRYCDFDDVTSFKGSI